MNFAAAFVIGIVLGVVRLAQTILLPGSFGGLEIALLVWGGSLATLVGSAALSGRPKSWVLIDLGYSLTSYLVMGAILGSFNFVG